MPRTKAVALKTKRNVPRRSKRDSSSSRGEVDEGRSERLGGDEAVGVEEEMVGPSTEGERSERERFPRSRSSRSAGRCCRIRKPRPSPLGPDTARKSGMSPGRVFLSSCWKSPKVCDDTGEFQFGEIAELGRCRE